MKHRSTLGIVLLACAGFAFGMEPAVITVRMEQTAEHAPAIGVNEFGDSGGIRYSAGNRLR